MSPPRLRCNGMLCLAYFEFFSFQVMSLTAGSSSATSTTTSLPNNAASTNTGTTTTGTASTGTSSTSASATPTAPSQPATVANYKWYGCQTEATGIRALSSTTYADDTMTLESCAAFCTGYSYFGVEYGRKFAPFLSSDQHHVVLRAYCRRFRANPRFC